MSKKYWDVIPPEKPDKRNSRYEELIELIKKHSEEERETMPYRMPFTQILPDAPCMHRNCPNCHGTGVGRMGTCIHMISCPCPNCSPTMMMSANTAH